MIDSIIYGVVITALPIFILLLLRWNWIPLLMLWLLPVFKAYLASRVQIFQTVDLTVAVLALTCVMCVFKYKNLKRFKKNPLLIFVILHCSLGLVMAISLYWTNAEDYGFSKTMKYSVFSLISFAAPCILFDSTKDVKTFLTALVFGSIFVAATIIVSPSYQQLGRDTFSNRVSAFESNPLNPCFLLAVAASVCFLIQGKLAPIQRIFYSAVFLLLEYGIFLTGSRSMFVQPILALSTWALITKSDYRWILRAAIVAMVIGMPLYVISDPNMRDSRVGDALTNPSSAVFEKNGRLIMWKFCLYNAWDAPIAGHGTGSFAVDFFGGDSRNFPHNLFLEALYETGLLGFLLLFSQFFLVAKSYFRVINSKTDRAFETAVFAAVVAASLSISLHWDIADNRLLWNLFGLLFVIQILSKKEDHRRFPQQLFRQADVR